MAIDVTAILRELLAGNLGPDSLNPGCRLPQTYGVTGSIEGNCLVMESALFLAAQPIVAWSGDATWVSPAAIDGRDCARV